MLKVVAVNDVDPQNPPQAAVLCSLQPVPLCMCQRPCLIIVNEIWNDKRATNLHLGLHRKVAIPQHMGKLHKSAQPMRMMNINLLLQASMGVDNASQIHERLHQLLEATTNGGVNRQLGGTPTIDMILVLATLMCMAISDAYKSTTFNISTNFLASMLNITMSSAYNNTTMVARDKGLEPGVYTSSPPD